MKNHEYGNIFVIMNECKRTEQLFIQPPLSQLKTGHPKNCTVYAQKDYIESKAVNLCLKPFLYH